MRSSISTVASFPGAVLDVYVSVWSLVGIAAGGGAFVFSATVLESIVRACRNPQFVAEESNATFANGYSVKICT